MGCRFSRGDYVRAVQRLVQRFAGRCMFSHLLIDQQVFASCLCLCRLSGSMVVYPPIVEGVGHNTARPAMNYMQSHHTCGLLLHSVSDITNLARASRMRTAIGMFSQETSKPVLGSFHPLFWSGDTFSPRACASPLAFTLSRCTGFGERAACNMK